MEEENKSSRPDFSISGRRVPNNPYNGTDFCPAGAVLGREYLEPCLDTQGRIIAARVNERLARKMDAAKFLDEAKLGLWDNRVAPPSFKLLKRSYDNQAFHFKDEEK